MKTDRELLELAAKAAGYEVLAEKQAQRDKIGYGSAGLWIKGVSTCWNPLTDDGAALRLSVRLHIDTRLNNGSAEAIWIDEDLSETHRTEVPCNETFEGLDAKYAATRRAIVRAAAEIGESMP